MRRNSRMKRNDKKVISNKLIIYSIIGVVALIAVLVGLLIYSKSLNDEVREGTMTLEQMANMANNTNNTKSASTEIGKTVENAKNELDDKKISDENVNSNTVSNSTNEINSNEKEKIKNNNKENVKLENKQNSNSSKTNSEVKKEEPKKELSFSMPVDGEILKEYAKDNLVYSNTLEEWTTHLGIDIKAEKTTVVKASEEGTIKSIKNDPRYGLTIVIEHQEGYKTVYSNLLTSEFVVEGEKVSKGQSLGTVGNTAVFEMADEPHLHFEILKDNIQIDPNICLK